MLTPASYLPREKVAIDCLKVASWAVEPAIDYFYTSGLSASVSSLDNKQIEALYNRYKGVWLGGPLSPRSS